MKMEVKIIENKEVAFVDQINNTGRKYKALVVLYGAKDYGKTTILKKFIKIKTGKQVSSIRCKFQVNSHMYCVCTAGDTRSICEKNCAAFDITASNLDIPLICITAARIGNGASSVADVFDYYSRKIREDCYVTLWINIKELLATAAKQVGISGYDKSKDLKHQVISNKLIDLLTNEACKLLDKQIQEIERL